MYHHHKDVGYIEPQQSEIVEVILDVSSSGVLDTMVLGGTCTKNCSDALDVIKDEQPFDHGKATIAASLIENRFCNAHLQCFFVAAWDCHSTSTITFDVEEQQLKKEFRCECTSKWKINLVNSLRKTLLTNNAVALQQKGVLQLYPRIAFETLSMFQSVKGVSSRTTNFLSL